MEIFFIIDPCFTFIKKYENLETGKQILVGMPVWPFLKLNI